MKALSIRQPWASLIVLGLKPVENRTWRTNYRGQLLIHAAQTFDREGWCWVCANTETHRYIDMLAFKERAMGLAGGIIGQVELYDCTDYPEQPGGGEPSGWFTGKHGLWLRDPRELPFHPLRGQLGLFEVPTA